MRRADVDNEGERLQCSRCARSSDRTLCPRCEKAILGALDDIESYYHAAHFQLLPARTGAGYSSSEMTIGVNIAALSFIAGSDILGTLHSWEVLIRPLAGLQRPYLVGLKSVDGQVRDAIAFAKENLMVSSCAQWFSDYCHEIFALAQMGKVAARDYASKIRRIKCPATDHHGLPCKATIEIDHNDLLALFECRRCHTQWSSLRLIMVALSEPTQPLWLDSDAIAVLMGVSERQVRRLAHRHRTPRKGQLYEVRALMKVRSANEGQVSQ